MQGQYAPGQFPPPNKSNKTWVIVVAGLFAVAAIILAILWPKPEQSGGSGADSPESPPGAGKERSSRSAGIGFLTDMTDRFDQLDALIRYNPPLREELYGNAQIKAAASALAIRCLPVIKGTADGDFELMRILEDDNEFRRTIHLVRRYSHAISREGFSSESQALTRIFGEVLDELTLLSPHPPLKTQGTLAAWKIAGGDAPRATERDDLIALASGDGAAYALAADGTAIDLLGDKNYTLDIGPGARKFVCSKSGAAALLTNGKIAIAGFEQEVIDKASAWENVTDLAIGHLHVLACDHHGKLLRAGDNRFRQSASPKPLTKAGEASTGIRALAEHVVSVAASDNRSAALTARGTLWAWGARGTKWQIGDCSAHDVHHIAFRGGELIGLDEAGNPYRFDGNTSMTPLRLSITETRTTEAVHRVNETGTAAYFGSGDWRFFNTDNSKLELNKDFCDTSASGAFDLTFTDNKTAAALFPAAAVAQAAKPVPAARHVDTQRSLAAQLATYESLPFFAFRNYTQEGTNRQIRALLKSNKGGQIQLLSTAGKAFKPMAISALIAADRERLTPLTTPEAAAAQFAQQVSGPGGSPSVALSLAGYSTVDFRNIEGRPLFSVNIGGKTCDMLVDTGAMVNLLDEDIAIALGLKQGERERIGTWQGSIIAWNTEASDVSIDGIELGNVPFLVAPKWDALAGIIGHGTLAKLGAILDFGNRLAYLRTRETPQLLTSKKTWKTTKGKVDGRPVRFERGTFTLEAEDGESTELASADLDPKEFEQLLAALSVEAFNRTVREKLANAAPSELLTAGGRQLSAIPITEKGQTLRVPLAVDGNTYDFFLDSGARRIMISQRVASDELGYSGLERGLNFGHVGGAEGAGSPVWRLPTKNIKFGPILKSGFIIGAYDFSHMHKIRSYGTACHGVIGSDFLDEFGAIIDYRSRSVWIQSP